MLSVKADKLTLNFFNDAESFSKGMKLLYDS